MDFISVSRIFSKSSAALDILISSARVFKSPRARSAYVDHGGTA
jgi:hypothetical protein